MVTEKMIEAAKAEAKALADRAGIDIGDDHDMFVDDLAQTLTRFAALSTDAEPVKTAPAVAVNTVYAKAEKAYAAEYHKNGVFEDALKAALTSALSAQVQDVAGTVYEYRLLTAEGREYARLNAKTDDEAHNINDGNFAGRLTVQRRVVPDWEVVAAPAAKLEEKP